MRFHARVILGCTLCCVIFTFFVKNIFSIPLRSQHKHPLSAARKSVAVRESAAPKEGSLSVGLQGPMSDQVLQMVMAKARNAEVSSDSDTEEQILTKSFNRCDTDKSSTVSLEEAVACIGQQVSLHLTQALRENFFIFTAVDQNPRNGAVAWTEHVTYFLRKRGYDQHFVDAHLNTVKGLKRSEKEELMRDKAAWSEAARDDPDSLSLDEFLAFRHPESSHATILSGVEEIISMGDINDDGLLTRAEYADSGPAQQPFDDIDSNKDGKLSRKELLLYRDPRHPHHSRVEAERLLAAADTNADGALTLQELLQQARLFATSKMVDAAYSFHNEF